jgi:hypothetical protein
MFMLVVEFVVVGKEGWEVGMGGEEGEVGDHAHLVYFET